MEPDEKQWSQLLVIKITNFYLIFKLLFDMIDIYPKGVDIMKAFTRLFENLFTKSATSDVAKIYREWDRQRASAYGPTDLAEIDAIFSRHLSDHR